MNKEYTGDIYMITSVDTKLLDFLQTHDIIDLCACKYVLAKQDANLIRVTDNSYIDLDSIKNINYIRTISELLDNESVSNLIMQYNVDNPYVGQLFVKNLKQIDKKKLKYTR